MRQGNPEAHSSSPSWSQRDALNRSGQHDRRVPRQENRADLRSLHLQLLWEPGDGAQSGSEGDDPARKGSQPDWATYTGRGNNATQARAPSKAQRHAFNGELRNLWNRGWSVEANVPSLEQAGQGTPPNACPAHHQRDACVGLVEAAAECDTKAQWQRCVVLWYRNVFSRVPRAKRS